MEANVVLLRQGERTVALVSCDLLYVGSALRGGVHSRVGHVLPPEGLFMAASHTHFAPMTQRGMPALGEVDEGYLQQCIDSISACILDLKEKLVPARLAFRCEDGPPGWSINRRLTRLRLWKRGFSWGAGAGPNPAGTVDPAIRAIRVDGDDGRAVAVLWNYACHPTAYPDGTSVSAEYPGRVREALRSEMQAGLPVLFFQGFAGDVRPPFRKLIRTPRDLVLRVVLGPGFGDPGKGEYQAWTRSMADAVLRMVQAGEGRPLLPDLSFGRATIDLAALADGPTGSKVIGAHCVRLSQDIVLAGLAAEPLAGFRAVLERSLAGTTLVPVGYVDQVEAYLPTDHDLPGGGYEVTGFRDAFAMRGRFHAGIDSAVGELVGRAMPPGATSRRGEGDRRDAIRD